MGILNDIEKHQSNKKIKKIIIILIVLIIGTYFSYSYFFESSKIVEEVKQTQSISVKKGDLKTSISGDGKILYKDDYNLNFPISGTVKEIYKNVGDSISAGEKIASLDTTYLQIDVDKAEIALQKAQADLNAKINSNTENDINLAKEQLETTKTNFENVKLSGEIDIQNSQNNLTTAQIGLDTAENDLEVAKNNLELIRKQEEEIYFNKLEDIIVVIGSNVSYNKEVLLKIDTLLGITDENKDKNDDFENYLGAKNTSIRNDSISSFNNSNDLFLSFLDEWKLYRNNNLSDIYDAYIYLNKAVNISKSLNNTLGLTLETIKNSIASVDTLSQSDIDNYINDYENEILKNKDELHDLINIEQVALEQKTSMETKIQTQENTIKTLESKLILANQNLDEAKIALDNSNKKLENNLILAQKQVDISQITLNDKTTSPSYSELAPYYSNIDTAKKNLEEAKIKLNDAVLYSPIDGKIVDVNGNIGSYVGGDKDTYFVSITNNSNFYVESYIEELDITRIQKDAKVYLTFDAIDGLTLEGRVYFISDKSTTDNNGVVTYRIEIQFDPENSQVREGMTTYIEFITQEVQNAKIIPVGSVKSINGKPSVKLENGEYKEIITGFTDGKMVEVISGLEIGDVVVY